MAVTVLEQQKIVEFVSGNDEVSEPASASVIMDSMVASRVELEKLWKEIDWCAGNKPKNP